MNIFVSEFIDDMNLAYSACDLLVTRAGATTIAEILVLEIPSVLIPSPNVAENHQYHNAKYLTSNGAAVLLKDSEVKDKLSPALLNIITDNKRLQELKDNCRKLSRPDAAVVMQNEQSDLRRPDNMNKTVFKYNLSFYYQSTIIYFIAFLVYVVIRGQFVEGSFTLITKDPIIYFFAAVVFISLIALLFNMYNQRRLEISDSTLAFVDRSRRKEFPFSSIKEIKFKRRRGRFNDNMFRIIRIKIKNKQRAVIIRPGDYENESKLTELIEELKNRINKENV